MKDKWSKYSFKNGKIESSYIRQYSNIKKQQRFYDINQEGTYEGSNSKERTRHDGTCSQCVMVEQVVSGTQDFGTRTKIGSVQTVEKKDNTSISSALILGAPYENIRKENSLETHQERRQGIQRSNQRRHEVKETNTKRKSGKEEMKKEKESAKHKKYEAKETKAFERKEDKKETKEKKK